MTRTALPCGHLLLDSQGVIVADGSPIKMGSVKLKILCLRQNSGHQCRVAFNLGKMPPHNGVHDHARVRIVYAFGAEKFTLLIEPADEFLSI